MEKDSNTTEFKFTNNLWWICMIIGIIIGLINSDSRYIDSQPLMEGFKGAVIGALLGKLLAYIIDQIKESPVAKTVIESVEKKIEEEQIKKEVKSSIGAYNEAVHHFQFLSDETLIAMYNEEIDKENKMEKLALEEELVKRKILKYSPEHEKINKLKSSFDSPKNEFDERELMISKEFIAQRLGCRVDNVKQAFFYQLESMGYQPSDLLESERAFSIKAKEEAELFGIDVGNTPSHLVLKWSREYINQKD